MLAFIQDYRQLTRIAQPKLAPVVVSELFETIQHLMSSELEKSDINFKIDIKQIKAIQLDSHLIEQVLINLITNSIHALEGVSTPEIKLQAYESMGKSVIEVSDNGCGIAEKELTQIFVPFFSTKKQGSGIGLSLSKQIMHLHKGHIKVNSIVGEGTAIRLFFPVKH